MPSALADFLAANLPRELASVHRETLRDKGRGRSWIAFQQRAYRDIGTDVKQLLEDSAVIRSGITTANRRLKNVAQDLTQTKIAVAKTADSVEGLHKKLDGRLPPTTLWTIPPPTHNFHDRPHLLTQIDHALTQGATALTALHGLGGIGKTQLALRFAQQRRTNYTAGVWLRAENEVALLTSLSAVATDLGLPPDQDQTALAHRTLHHLATLTPWLVTASPSKTTGKSGRRS